MAEFCPRRASSSRIRSCRARISAWAALGVAAQISGGRGASVSAIDRGIRRRRLVRKPLSQGGAERLLFEKERVALRPLDQQPLERL